MDNLLIDFAIITAIKVERLAILKAFGITDDDRIHKDSRTYWRKRLLLNNGSFYEVVVAQSLDMANVNSAIVTNDMLHHWKPAAVIMVGIAAAAKSEPKQSLGNLVVAKEVYYYEMGKITTIGKLPEPKQVPVDATLLDRVQALPELDFPILAERPDGTSARPEVEVGVIASGDKVISDASKRDAIAATNRKILAIEMEGYGVISAAWQSFHQVRCLVIRSLCDYADANKHDQWHAYAAAVVAGFTKHFLLDKPLSPRNSTKALAKRQSEESELEITGQDSKQNALDLLNSLIRSQFDAVVFRYGADPAHLSNGTQNQQAIDLIQYAIQKEGADLSRLLAVIYTVASYLKKG